jgi:hypothetical protein
MSWVEYQERRCRTCKWWKSEIESEGECWHPKVESNGWPRRSLDGAWYSYDEGGCIETGPEFGCVHWEGK